jgi:hypothetical protein
MKLFNLATAPYYYSYGPNSRSVAPSSQSRSAGDGVHGDPIDKALATADVPARLRRPLIGRSGPQPPGSVGPRAPLQIPANPVAPCRPRVAFLPQPRSFWA